MPRYNILTVSVKILFERNGKCHTGITNKKKVTETLVGSELKHVCGQRGYSPIEPSFYQIRGKMLKYMKINGLKH